MELVSPREDTAVQAPPIRCPASEVMAPSDWSDTLLELVDQSEQSGIAGQSEQTGLYWEEGLQETGAKTKCFRQRLKRGPAAVDSLRKVMCFLHENLFK